jgi:hypothetical protein
MASTTVAAHPAATNHRGYDGTDLALPLPGDARSAVP